MGDVDPSEPRERAGKTGSPYVLPSKRIREAVVYLYITFFDLFVRKGRKKGKVHT